MKLYLCSVTQWPELWGSWSETICTANHLKKKVPYTIQRNNGIAKKKKINTEWVIVCVWRWYMVFTHHTSHSVSTYHSLSVMMYVCLCSTYLPANIGSKQGSRRGPKATSDKKSLGFKFLADPLDNIDCWSIGCPRT